MKAVGIVCEYNPFHNGHKRQIELQRQNGADCIICIMSGNYTQRGEPAITDKYLRAEMAIKCGADIVLELPFPCSSLSAEGFARAGVYILDRVGAETLSFGSECGDTETLTRAADIICRDAFKEIYAELIRGGAASTAAYMQAYEQICGEKADFSSNDLLGIAYIQAIRSLGLNIIPEAIKRNGSAYTEKSLDNTLPSATALREHISNNGTVGLENFTPSPVIDILASAEKSGKITKSDERLSQIAHSFFRLHTPEEIVARATAKCGGASVLDDGCGLVNRLCEAARAESAEKFFDQALHSRYTHSRIRRVILYSLLGVSEAVKDTLPQSVLLLGASQVGCKHLSGIRKNPKIEIITKPADLDTSSTYINIAAQADSLYTMLTDSPLPADYFIKRSPYIAM